MKIFTSSAIVMGDKAGVPVVVVAENKRQARKLLLIEGALCSLHEADLSEVNVMKGQVILL